MIEEISAATKVGSPIREDLQLDSHSGFGCTVKLKDLYVTQDRGNYGYASWTLSDFSG